VDETDFVKMLVKLLASLVDGDNGSQVEGIGCYPKRLNKLQSSGCIQTTSRANQKMLISNLVFNLKRQITDLSQQPMRLRAARVSAIDTRFFSPPLTPRNV